MQGNGWIEHSLSLLDQLFLSVSLVLNLQQLVVQPLQICQGLVELLHRAVGTGSNVIGQLHQEVATKIGTNVFNL